MGLTALPDPHALDLAVRLDPRILGVTVMPTQAPGSTRRHTWLLDPRRLDLATHAKLKQITNKERIIVYFSYQKREKRKKKTQTIDHRWQSNHDMFTCVGPCERGHFPVAKSAPCDMTDV